MQILVRGGAFELAGVYQCTFQSGATSLQSAPVAPSSSQFIACDVPAVPQPINLTFTLIKLSAGNAPVPFAGPGDRGVVFTFYTPIVSWGPVKGSAAGGDTLTFTTGGGLSGGASPLLYRCEFLAASHVAYSAFAAPSSDTQLSCLTPPWTSKADSTIVTIQSSQAGSTPQIGLLQFQGPSNSFGFTSQLLSVTPPSSFASGGAQALITGAGFDDQLEATCVLAFGPNTAVSAPTLPSSSTAVLCALPTWPYGAGALSLTVMQGGKSLGDPAKPALIFSITGRFTIIAPIMGNATGGTVLQVFGDGFNSTDNTYVCRFATVGYAANSLTVKPFNSSYLECRVPFW
jgi:hypothetical protein